MTLYTDPGCLSRYPNDYQMENVRNCEPLALEEWAMATYCRIRELREKHGFTQRELAQQLGMLQPQYFRYEQGTRDVPTDMLIRLADIYHVSIDYLLGQTDNPERAK